MKTTKKLFGIALVVIILCSFYGCNASKIQINTNQKSETYIEKEDYQNYLDLYSNMAKTDIGYYFINNSYLYYFDNESQETMLVCSKANCKHNDDNCTAYFSLFNYYPIQLSYYDNALYLLGWESEGANIHHNYIYQISLDNFKRRKAVYIGSSNGLSSTVFLIHRGNVYYITESNTMKETTAVVYCKQLGNTDRKDNGEVVFEYTGIGAKVDGISAYGNNLFVSLSSYKNEEGDGYTSLFYSVNIHNLESKCIFDNNKFAAYADENYVYYEKNENIVNRLDLKTNKEEFFCNIEGPAYVSADSQYIYFDNLQSVYIDRTDAKDRKIFIYDKTGKYITEITPKNPNDDCYFGGNDIMFFKEITDDGSEQYYAIDKTKLIQGETDYIDMG